MQKFKIPTNSFQFGEISESTLMRTDSPVYAASAQSIKNMVITVEGSAKKRDGLKHIYTYDDIAYSGAGESHLFKFVFSQDEQYIISVEHQKVRCFFLDDTGIYGDAGEVVLVSTITTDTSSNPLPFDRNWLKEYSVAQYGDVLFVCHPLFMPRMIVRTALNAFEVTTYAFDTLSTGQAIYQPYSQFHSQGVTIDPSATTGAVTITASQAYFTADHVGTIIRYNDTEIEVTGYTSPTQISGTVSGTLRTRLSVINPLRTSDGSNVIEVTHIDHGFIGGETIIVEDASAVGGINANSINGTRTVTTIIDANTYTFIAGASANVSEDGGALVKIVSHAPTTNWSEQSFSAVHGYPAAVTFHEGRLAFGGTISQPDTLWLSKSGEFFDFNVGDAEDNDAFDITAATGTVNTIRYLISNRDLQIFTDSAELYMPTYLNQALTPTNAQIRLQTPYGCEFVYPQPFDGATVFVQLGGRVVREYLYTDTENAYTSSSISGIASHLIHQPRCMTAVNAPFGGSESYIALTSGDGDLAMFSSNRVEKRAAWTHIETAGEFCSVVGMPSRLFANIWDENQVQHLVEFTGDTGLDLWVGGKLYDSQHLDVSRAYQAGDTVSVCSRNDTTGEYSYLGDFTVTTKPPYSAVVDLDGFYEAGLTYYAGIRFTAEIVSNPIDANFGAGPMTGSVRGIVSVTADFRNTQSASVNNRPLVTDTVFNGKQEFRILGYGRDPSVTISQTDPLPLQVNGFITEVVV